MLVYAGIAGWTNEENKMELKNKLAAFAAATNNEIYDPEYRDGEWMVEATETHETIDDFIQSSAKWASCTKDKFGEIAGFKFVAWSQVQPAKGKQRRSLSVIDFGEVRYALDCDLTDFS